MNTIANTREVATAIAELVGVTDLTLVTGISVEARLDANGGAPLVTVYRCASPFSAPVAQKFRLIPLEHTGENPS